MERLKTRPGVSTEWELRSSKSRANPWQEIEVSASLEGPGGLTRSLPLYWAGGADWRLRVSAEVSGRYTLRTVCSDAEDSGLHGKEAVLDVEGREGRPGIRAGQHFTRSDGRPFFWLGDTWWMLMSDRVQWPDDFRVLTRDRIAKGFTVAQVVVGYPGDLATDDPRVGNEGGLPWSRETNQINPAYFDSCDLRLYTMIREGLTPCILGSWGYHLLSLGEATMASHWKYLVARYGAWPVIWALAGETAMAYYLSKTAQEDTEELKRAWTRVAKAVKAYDPYKRPLGTHPRRTSWDDLTDPTVLDYHMLQPGHMPNSLGLAVQMLEDGRKRFPGTAIVNAEPPYEGHMGANGPEIQRFAFWSSLLSGAAGFTYGAGGIFQANDKHRQTGNRPDGGAYDAATWDEALDFPGATQLGHGKRLLETLPWELFEPHPEWAEVSVRFGEDQYNPPLRVYSAGVRKVCRVHYIPRRYWHWEGPVLHGLEAGTVYKATYFDPQRMTEFDAGVVNPDKSGDWKAPQTPYLMEWLLVLQAKV